MPPLDFCNVRTCNKDNFLKIVSGLKDNFIYNRPGWFVLLNFFIKKIILAMILQLVNILYERIKWKLDLKSMLCGFILFTGVLVDDATWDY